MYKVFRYFLNFLAKECMQKAQDYGGLLLLATSSGDENLVRYLAETSQQEEKFNLSFLSYLLVGDLQKCLNILIDTGRLPEAAFFARSYLPDKISDVVELWKEKLSQTNEKAGQSLADPKQYENLFPGKHFRSEHLKMFLIKDVSIFRFS